MSEEQRLIAELLKRLAALKAENAELRRCLDKNSQNSHKPPSSDGYRKKSVQPGLPKREKQALGGKPGHKGKTLHQVERPDKVQVHLSACCSGCGRTVSAEEEPPPKVKQGKGRPKNTPGRNLLRRLQQHEEAVLAFSLVEGIPFTNNLAERDLRPAKVSKR